MTALKSKKIRYILVLIFIVSFIGFVLLRLVNGSILKDEMGKLYEDVERDKDIYIQGRNGPDAVEAYRNIAVRLSMDLSKNNSKVRVYDETRLLCEALSGGINDKPDFHALSEETKKAFRGESTYNIKSGELNLAVPVRFNEKVVGAIEYTLVLGIGYQMRELSGSIFLILGLAVLMYILVIWLFYIFGKKKPEAKEAIVGNIDELSDSKQENNALPILKELQTDFEKKVVKINGEIINLTPKEFEILKVLMESKGSVISRDELLNKVWGYEYFGDTRVVDIQVTRLRKKIEDDPANPVLIKTVFGFGYKFEN